MLLDLDGCARIAAIDLGTVSSRLSLARVRDGAIVDSKKHSVITDMGQGVDATGRFSAGAIDRVEAACRTFAKEARSFGATATCVTLTSAARDAENAEELLARLRALGLARRAYRDVRFRGKHGAVEGAAVVRSLHKREVELAHFERGEQIAGICAPKMHGLLGMALRMLGEQTGRNVVGDGAGAS